MSSPAERNRTLKAGVIGWPVAHSLSPTLHGYWLKEHHINGRYDRLAIPPEDLKSFLSGLKDHGLQGVNVTLPHKENACQLMDETSSFARRVQAVNTVIVRDDGSLFGDNTDGFGFIESLKSSAPTYDFANAPAVVLGAGGAARAILAALHDAGVPEIRLTNRTRQRAEDLVSQLDIPVDLLDWPLAPDALSDAGLVINTTSLGLKGTPSGALLNMARALPAKSLVTDIVYTPLITPFLQTARDRGAQTVDGLGMLLHQARPGFEAWFGVTPAVTPELRQALLTALDG